MRFTVNIKDFDSNDSITFTSTKRLERAFLDEHGKLKAKQGIQAWRRPQCYSLSSWLDKTWGELQSQGYPQAAEKIRISKPQLLSLWSRSIDSKRLAGTALTSTSLALAAFTANQSLNKWMVEDFSSFTGSQEIEHFLAWKVMVDAKMEHEGWVDDEGILRIIADAISNGHVSVPQSVGLYGFDELPPITSTLLKSMELAGSHVVEICQDDGAQPSPARFSSRQRKTQVEACARWAKRQIEDNPDISIGIVCPELSDRRSEISEAFAKVFEPQYSLPSTARYTLPFNFSAGTPLADIPIIKDAIDMLSINTKHVRHHQLSKLLRSPYIAGYIKESTARNAFDQVISARSSYSLSLDSVLKISGAPTILSEHIGKFMLHIGNQPAYQKPSQWAVFFSKALDQIGWPGDRQLDSEEYQALLHWHTILDHLSSLDLMHTECGYNKALSMLQQILVAETFQPQTSNSPIQILGILEAGGMKYDALWVMDMNDDIWPASAQPSPFIPLHLQKSLRMPHASSDRELDYAKRIVRRLAISAPNVVFSYAELDDDRELRCSAIIDDLEHASAKELGIDDAQVIEYSQVLYGAAEPAPINDGVVPYDSSRSAKGGAGILQAQQECPFRAFAKYRLNATEENAHQLGLSPLERGDLVHLVLESVWKTISSHDELTQQSPEERDQLITNAIDSAFFWIRGRRSDLGDRFFEIERDRLYSLTTEWLKIEEQRTPFKVVSTEAMTEAEIGPLSIRIKKDRVDEVDGKRFYIDYKTGRSTLSGWNPESLSKPQIPLYTITDDHSSIGAAVAQVRSGEAQFKGVSENSEIAPGLVTSDKARANLPGSWAETKEAWKTRLEEVASDFVNGNSAVAPASRSVCQSCHLAALCRRS